MIKLLLVAVFVGIGWPSAASACSCEPISTIEDHIRSADAIFWAIASETNESKTESSYLDVATTFDVIEVLKGFISPKQIVLHPSFGGANCGLDFQKGREYPVFAILDDQNRLITTECLYTGGYKGSGIWPWEDYRKALEKVAR